MKNMWDDRGYFYYQVHPAYRNRISFMRWSQAWMLLALSAILSRAIQRGAAVRNVTYALVTPQKRGSLYRADDSIGHR